jgi:hypothetical protein
MISSEGLIFLCSFIGFLEFRYLSCFFHLLNGPLTCALVNPPFLRFLVQFSLSILHWSRLHSELSIGFYTVFRVSFVAIDHGWCLDMLGCILMWKRLNMILLECMIPFEDHGWLFQLLLSIFWVSNWIFRPFITLHGCLSTIHVQYGYQGTGCTVLVVVLEFRGDGGLFVALKLSFQLPEVFYCKVLKLKTYRSPLCALCAPDPACNVPSPRVFRAFLVSLFTLVVMYLSFSPGLILQIHSG